jgi:hypothetical protein
MTTRGQINSNFYQIVNVDVDGNPTEVKPEYITGGNVDHANVADVANSVSVSNVVGIGNIATTNYDNDANHVLYGNGVWANINSVPTANANYANFAGNSFGVNAAVGNVYITGGTNGYVLQTDGNGNLTWTAQTGGGGNASPGGANTQIQYNDSGNFAGSANFTFNNVTDTVTLAGNLTVGNITSVDSITFDTANSPGVTTVAQLDWDDGDGTLELLMKGGNVTQQIGTQEFARVHNSEATTLNKGEVVYVFGAVGNRLSVKRAQADTEATSFGTVGFVAESIASGAEGFIITSGALYKLNTNGLTAGNAVYLSPTVAGGYTTTKPVAPDQLVVLGWIERVSTTVGSIYVKVDNGYEIDELHDVLITSPVAGQALVYNSSNLWVNGNPNVANYAGYVTQAAQSNITSLGTLTSLSVSGNITAGNINGGNLVSANYFSGNGSSITGIVGGVTGDIQFNNGSSFGGANSFTFDGNLTHPNVTLNTPTGIIGTSPRTVTLNFITGSGAGNIGRSNASGGTNSLFINDANAVSISAPTVNLGANSNVKITGGSSGQVLSTDGVGNLSWASTLTITGSNTQVFYNDNGALGASANLTFNNTTNTLSVTNITGNGAGLTSITGANVTGTVANANYANFAGDVVNSAQPNITSLGTLTSLSVTGNISGGNISTIGLANLANVQLKIYEETVLASANTSTSITPDLSTGSIFRYTANASFTFNSMANAVAGSSATVIVTQDGTGGRTLTSTMKFAGGAKTLSTAASAIDIISVFYDGTTYYATLSKGYA